VKSGGRKRVQLLITFRVYCGKGSFATCNYQLGATHINMRFAAPSSSNKRVQEFMQINANVGHDAHDN